MRRQSSWAHRLSGPALVLIATAGSYVGATAQTAPPTVTPSGYGALKLLDPAAVDHLQQVFAPLRRGDVVSIDYPPGRGTTVHINSSTAVRGARHELMLAFLDHWVGQRPVSEEVKRALLGQS